MNISAISAKTWLGKLLRQPLRLIPPTATVPILQGRLRGMRWIVGAGTHGCWLGSYEYRQRVLFEAMIKEGTVVFDIGAQAGFYTLLAAILVGPRGRVYAFEPVPRNLFYLKEHLRLNNLSNVTVIEAAVADGCGSAALEAGPNPSEGRLASRGQLRVRTVSLDELIARQELPEPDYLKIDVEGAELLVLKGAEATIAKHHPTILLSTHGDDIHKQCGIFLDGLHYHLKPINSSRLDIASEILAYYER